MSHRMNTVVVLMTGFSINAWPQVSYSIRVNASTQFQRFEGFGATVTPFEEDGVFHRHDFSAPIVVSATPAQKDAIAGLLYGRGSGQLGIARSRFFPRRFEETNDNNDASLFQESSYTWGLFNAITDFVATAQSRGLNRHFASFGGGLVEEWLRARNSQGEVTCRLDPSMVDEYVEMELRAALRYREKGETLEYLAVTNEPDSAWQNGTCTFIDPATFAEVVRRLGNRLRTSGLNTKLVITDGIAPRSSKPYIEAVLNSAEAAQYVGAIAYHSYDGYANGFSLLENSAKGQLPADILQDRRDLRDKAAAHGWTFWMTEVCWCFNDPTRTGGRSDYELARLRLNHLYDELTEAGAEAFDIMNAYFISFRRPDTLIEVRFRADGSLESFGLTNLGRMIGQFSMALEPGSRRVYVDRVADPAVRPVAFLRTDGTPAVMVLNNTNAPVTMNVTLAGFPTTPNIMSVLTSREGAMWQRSSVTVAAGVATITAPPLGIATITR